MLPKSLLSIIIIIIIICCTIPCRPLTARTDYRTHDCLAIHNFNHPREFFPRVKIIIIIIIPAYWIPIHSIRSTLKLAILGNAVHMLIKQNVVPTDLSAVYIRATRIHYVTYCSTTRCKTAVSRPSVSSVFEASESHKPGTFRPRAVDIRWTVWRSEPPCLGAATSWYAR